ncbi:sigma-70 domain-containing protein [Micromonospora haikouensis]|uniref:sigma-70 domain-containing protein n=1 Tax=Micromonospora haikouensis TaxID=686309 RepID=UPI00379367B0
MDRNQLAQAHERLTRELRREPSGSELAQSTDASLSTAKRWKQARAAQGVG